MKSTITLLSIAILIFSSCTAQKTPGITQVNTEKFATQIQKPEITLVDVRTPEEYQAGHLIGAQNINFLDPDFLTNMEQFSKDDPIYIYCQSGNRSGKAANLLVENGFKNIIDLSGGYGAWKASNLPSEL